MSGYGFERLKSWNFYKMVKLWPNFIFYPKMKLKIVFENFPSKKSNKIWIFELKWCLDSEFDISIGFFMIYMNTKPKMKFWSFSMVSNYLFWCINQFSWNCGQSLWNIWTKIFVEFHLFYLCLERSVSQNVIFLL